MKEKGKGTFLFRINFRNTSSDMNYEKTDSTYLAAAIKDKLKELNKRCLTLQCANKSC